VEVESLVSEEFKKFVEDIWVGSRSQDVSFADMPSLDDVHE